MKKIKELEILVNFARSLGQKPDPAMVEQIRKHYELQKSIIESVRSTAAKDLNAAFGTTSIKEKPNELVQSQAIEESILREEEPYTAIADEAPPEALIKLFQDGLERQEESLAERTAKFISEAPKKDSYQQPDIPLTPETMKAVQDKLRFLEQWLSKVSTAGPGGGAVKLKDLDDVSKYSIKNATENQYLTYNAQSKLWIATNHTNTNIMSYGQFWDTTTQVCNANTATLMKFNRADGRIGVSLANANTRVILQNAGTYNLQFSSQFVNGSNSPENTWIWFRQANVDLSDSAGLVAVPKKDGAVDGATIVSWNTFVTTTVPNDYVELVWFTIDQTNNQMTAYPAANAVIGTSPPIPAIPSVILTVEQIT
jgi:hypothetical protein